MLEYDLEWVPTTTLSKKWSHRITLFFDGSVFKILVLYGIQKVTAKSRILDPQSPQQTTTKKSENYLKKTWNPEKLKTWKLTAEKLLNNFWILVGGFDASFLLGDGNGNLAVNINITQHLPHLNACDSLKLHKFASIHRSLHALSSPIVIFRDWSDT